jgi:hypothetical protein
MLRGVGVGCVRNCYGSSGGHSKTKTMWLRLQNFSLQNFSRGCASSQPPAHAANHGRAAWHAHTSAWARHLVRRTSTGMGAKPGHQLSHG